MSSPLTITLCADDFGYSLPVCQGILQLVFLGRLSAVSCMSTMPFFNTFIPQLLEYKNRVDIGLHLNLTEGEPLGNTSVFRSLPKWLAFTSMRCLSKKQLQAVEDELARQLDLFLEKTGGVIHFIDGHQHIHHLPLIRDIVLKLYHSRLKGAEGFYFRNSVQPSFLSADWACKFKAWVIRHTGGRAFRKMLMCENIPHNSVFAGVYPHSRPALFEESLKRLAHHKDRLTGQSVLVMCHPALPAQNGDRAGKDPIRQAREHEYACLKGGLLNEMGVQLR